MARLGALALALVLVLSAGASAQRPLTRIRVVSVPVMIYSPLFVAAERGYFAEQGIEIVFESQPGGVQAFTPVAAGHAEVAVTGLGSALFNAAARRLDFKVVAPAHTERPPVATPLVISKRAWDSGAIKSVADLRGRRVSVNVAGSATEFWLNAALNRGGLTMGDVEMVAVNFPDVPAALQSGAIAAGMLGEPLATLAERQGLIHRLSTDFINGVQVTAVIYSGAFVRERRELAVRWMVGYLKAVREIERLGFRNDAIAAVVEKYTRVPADVVKQAARPYYEPNGRVNLNDFARLQEFFKKRGALTYQRLIDPRTFVDQTIVRDALARLGQ